MVTEILTAAINGIDSRIIKVETDISTGLPCMELIGSASVEVKEAKERVRVALKNIGISFPPCHITINLSPANIRKDGTGYDLPIAVSLLIGLGRVKSEGAKNIFFAGEVGLNGEIKRINGILPMMLEAKRNEIYECVVPRANLKEASVISGINVYGITDVNELIGFLELDKSERKKYLLKDSNISVDKFDLKNESDFMDIKGQESLKRAIEVAAAGFHNILMIGPPGSGKTMVAKRIPGILPKLTKDESLEVSKIYSVCGMLDENESLITRRPFIAPHHSVSATAMAGGGKSPTPGIITKAHKGVLFLDELVHFSSATLEILRQPIEEKKIHVARVNWNYTFPAEFMLVGAMNPCPCGEYPDHNKCSCTPEQIRRYINRISGPILDRFDICVEAKKIDISDISGNINVSANGQKTGRTSADIRDNVIKAVMIQKNRYKSEGIIFNSQLSSALIEKYIILGNEERKFVEEIYNRLNLSARGYHRILKVSRTIADLDGSEMILKKHIMEAACYRSIEDKYWGL